jgi:hypothetical protein
VDDEMPRVTARQLARAETTCPRRLALDHDGQLANRPADRQYRLRNQIEADIRLAHATLGVPRPEHFRPTDDLEPEEQTLYGIAGDWYRALFGTEPMVVADTDTDDFETVARRTEVRLVGPAGLALESATGRRELRVVSLGDSPNEEILEAPGIRFALLRRPHWVRLGDLRIVRADLLGGWSQAVDLDGARHWDPLVEWFTDRVRTVRDHADRRAPRAGWECARCRYIAGCPALR